MAAPPCAYAYMKVFFSPQSYELLPGVLIRLESEKLSPPFWNLAAPTGSEPETLSDFVMLLPLSLEFMFNLFQENITI